ncbi:MAG: hypothetical protein K0R22_53 [Sporomusa sp.]|jgi:hypothetical protein|nr:hypothetical protein [Sporomusa sp.]
MLDDVLKITQICFYVGTMILGIRTFIYAKKNIKNTVHLEYQKKVIIRLDEIANALFREFDVESEVYWHKTHNFDNNIKWIDAIYEQTKQVAPESERLPLVPLYDSLSDQYLSSLFMKVKSDPFIPEDIRRTIVAYLEDRIEVTRKVYFNTYQKYRTELANGRFEKSSPLERHALFNSWAMVELHEKGYGIRDTEKKVNSIRFKIREYFEKYNPIK